jgi:iron(III) transport system permease protein
MEFTLINFTRTLSGSGLSYLKNSLLGALGAAVFGTITAYVFAYYSARAASKTSAVHLLSICTAAIPGIVLGLGYVLAFKGSMIYGTMIILILINIVHFFAPVYLLAYNALLKISRDVESVAEVFGIGKFKAFVDIILPNTFTTAVEMFSYFFVYSMITISAVSFIANIRIKPLALMIPQYENQQQSGNVAVVALVILAVNLLLKFIVWIDKNKKVQYI